MVTVPRDTTWQQRQGNINSLPIVTADVGYTLELMIHVTNAPFFSTTSMARNATTKGKIFLEI